MLFWKYLVISNLIAIVEVIHLPANSTSNSTSASTDKDDKDSSLRTTLALIIGFGLTAIIVGCLGFFLVRGYLEQKQYQNHRQLFKLNEGRDLFDLLMNAEIQDENGTIHRLTDLEITAQAIAFITASHETTASSICFTIYNLAIHPEHQEKVVQDIKEKFAEDEDPNYNNIQKLEYLEMVFEESLRLFSPVYRFDRQCTESCTIAGFKFEAGFNIGIAVENLLMNPEYWPDPEKFDPERFTPQAKAKRDQFCYLPFGGGLKTCLGYRFAYLLAKIALTSVLRKYKFAAAPETEIPPKRCVGITLHPVNGVWLTVERR